MSENRKSILDKFQQHLFVNYQQFCQRHNVAPSEHALVDFLIDQDLIPPVLMKRYAVVHEFENLFPKYEHHKTNTVNVLADRFNISERSVWGMLKGSKK